jgi:Cu-Zn family superoxide dismutase
MRHPFRFILAAASALAVQGCATGANESAGSAGQRGSGAAATVTLLDAAGNAKGQATLTPSGSGVLLAANVTGMAQGAYGIHLHTTGKCEGPAFTTAGPHWNPTQKMHGLENPQGRHMGDLPNVTVGLDGTGSVQATIAGASLTGGATPLIDADGAALVVHAAADDYKTDPSGNSGPRVACGIVTPA